MQEIYKSEAYKKHDKFKKEFNKKPWLFVEEFTGVKLTKYQKVLLLIQLKLINAKEYYKNPNKVLKKYLKNK